MRPVPKEPERLPRFERRDEAGGRFGARLSGSDSSDGESEAVQEASGAAGQSVAAECAGASGEAVDELERRRRRAERFKKEWAELDGPSRQ